MGVHSAAQHLHHLQRCGQVQGQLHKAWASKHIGKMGRGGSLLAVQHDCTAVCGCTDWHVLPFAGMHQMHAYEHQTNLSLRHPRTLMLSALLVERDRLNSDSLLRRELGQ